MKAYLKKNYKLILIKLSIVVFAIAIDLLLKFFIQKHFLDGGEKINIIKGVLSITYTENRGVAWGLFSGKTLGIIITSIVFVIILVVWDIFNTDRHPLNFIGFSLILAGAIGNFIDRIFLGYVRDFIALDFINFPIFNFADICITVGCILYVIYTLFIYTKKGKKEGEDAKSQDR